MNRRPALLPTFRRHITDEAHSSLANPCRPMFTAVALFSRPLLSIEGAVFASAWIGRNCLGINSWASLLHWRRFCRT